MDQRKKWLDEWVSAQVGVTVSGVSASSDASFRRYFRYTLPGRSVVAMDAPPPQEDCRPFVSIARQLDRGGVTVPSIIAEDLERGFLLLSDLGTQTLLEVIDEANADDYFGDAIDTLIRIQRLPCHFLPPYEDALLRRELELFPAWYLEKECGVTIDHTLRRRLDNSFTQLIESALAQPRVFVHRDYMPRNFMAGKPLGVLDFQDAVAGPISYDVISLFKDAFISWPEPRVEFWLREYWRKAQAAALPVATDFAEFRRQCDWMGMQRHLKVIGIFARICHRDGKPKYLKDVPRFFNYLLSVIEFYPALEDFGELLSRYQHAGQCRSADQ